VREGAFFDPSRFAPSHRKRSTDRSLTQRCTSTSRESDAPELCIRASHAQPLALSSDMVWTRRTNSFVPWYGSDARISDGMLYSLTLRVARGHGEASVQESCVCMRPPSTCISG
jgi:hypothetical protein